MYYDIEAIRKKALRYYKNRFYKEVLNNTFKSLRYCFKKVGQKQITNDFDRIRGQIQAVRGYESYIEYKTFAFSAIGTQRLPVAVVLETQDDFLAFIRKKNEYERFMELFLKSAKVKGVQQLLRQRPALLLGALEIWEKVLSIAAFLQKHPKPGIYLRQLPVYGIDTKFIENNKKLLDAVLSAVLDSDAVCEDVTSLSHHGFERKYFFKYPTPVVELRLLDDALCGFDQLSIPLERFQTLNLDCSKVFIVENRINMLSFPKIKDAVVIFGRGFGVEVLKKAYWLQGKQIFYWGDIDTHGFAIFSRLREYFPEADSMLMDKQTLLSHQQMWVKEPKQKKLQHTNLPAGARQLYEALFENRYGHNIRLEQERIAYPHILKAIDTLPYR